MNREKEIFEQALDLDSNQERVAFLKGACGVSLVGEARTLHLWDTASKALLSTVHLETTNVTWLCSSVTPEGNLLALANLRLLEVFETRTGRRVERPERPGYVDSIDLSRDGRFLAFTVNGTCTLWDVAARQPVWTVKGHRDRIHAVRFSPDQKMIATGSWDSNARLWDTTTGKELAVLTGHRAGLLNCVFSPDGRTLATKSDDRTIKFWNLATFTFDVVGYGVQDWTPTVQAETVRYWATPKRVTEGSALTGYNYIHHSSSNGKVNNGGSCNGDSGGPIFLAGSNVIVGVTSWGIDLNCAGPSIGYRTDIAESLDFLSPFLP